VAVWVALLRGINLGARNKVNMPALRAALTDAGFGNVRTYVQSGNIVAESAHRSPTAVGKAVAAVVQDVAGIDVPVVVRTPAQLQAVLDWNPFPEDAAERPTLVHVVHLAGDPDPDGLDTVQATDWGKDALAARGQEVVLRYAEAMHTSRLQYAPVLKKLKVDGTARNWRTLQALVDLCA
jgi:uncharacterized protein (DUF1697 family)